MGKLNKLLLPEGNDFIEVSQDKWPDYVDIIQREPQRIKD